MITGVSAQTQQPEQSQQLPKKQSVMMDTLDHKLDFSRYLIDMHGFIPWPSIISEPALGNFGLAMALVFISPQASARAKANYSFPDITGVAGMWTLNNSWGGGRLAAGSLPESAHEVQDSWRLCAPERRILPDHKYRTHRGKDKVLPVQPEICLRPCRSQRKHLEG
jgi:hypothetical protein